MQKLLTADIWTIVQTTEGSAVLLKPQNRSIAVPIFVGQLEVQSILIGKEGLSLPRPLTHDLFLSLLDSLNLVLDRVEIHELKENTFHARLVIHGGNFTEENPLMLDSRPSDAFGLATRSKCPILVSADIVKQTGIPLNLFVEALKSNIEKTSLDEKHRKLADQLNKAVETEDYERAAELRDMLKELEDED